MGMSMAVIGGVGALAGMFGGGGAGNVQMPPQFNMPNMPQAAQGAFNSISNIQPFADAAGGTIPFSQQAFGNLFNNPGAGTFTGAAPFAAGMGETAATNAFGAGGNLAMTGNNMLPYATSILNTGFDPQNALYNRTVQQVTDQTRAGLEARGMDNTPYGAGVEGQTLSNFNIDWQNNLLGREATAAGSAGGLVGAGGNAIGMGTGLQNAAPGQFMGAAGIPYGAFSTVGTGQNAAISSLNTNLGAGASVANMPFSDYTGYVGVGNQADSVANQNAQLQLNQNQLAFQQQMAYGQQLGASLYGFGRANSGNSPMFSSFFNPSPIASSTVA